MDRQSLKKFIDTITVTMIKAGELAISFQGKVKNIEKKAEKLQEDSAYIYQKRSAETIIDEQIQEMLLQSTLQTLDPNIIKLDAEEITPSTKLFTNNASTVLVLDPIDGTLEYLAGSNTYSVCVGVVNKGEIITSLVYFPVRKTLYYIDSAGKPYAAKFNSNLNLISKNIINPPSRINTKNIYRNNRVQSNIVSCLTSKGYKVFDDTNGKIVWPEAFLKCMSGEYRICLFHTPQIRDVLLGAIIEKMKNGYALDWKGNKLVWPEGGRVPRVIFGIGNPDHNIISCLT